MCLDFVKQLQNYNCEPLIWMLIVLHIIIWFFLGKRAWQSPVLMTIAVFQYLVTLSYSFLCVISSVLLLLCSVCFFNSLMWIIIFLCFVLWANKEPHEVEKYDTVFSSVKYLFSHYQRLRVEEEFGVFEDFLLFVNVDMQYTLWYSVYYISF